MRLKSVFEAVKSQGELHCAVTTKHGLTQIKIVYFAKLAHFEEVATETSVVQRLVNHLAHVAKRLLVEQRGGDLDSV